MTDHYCYYRCSWYYNPYNLNHYNQIAGGAGGWLLVASHDLHGQSVNAEHRGDSDGR